MNKNKLQTDRHLKHTLRVRRDSTRPSQLIPETVKEDDNYTPLRITTQTLKTLSIALNT